MLKKLLRVLRHPGLVRMALGNAVRLAEGDDIVKAAGVRLIMGHDYRNPSPRFGVTRAVDEDVIRAAVSGLDGRVELILPEFVDAEELKRLYASCDAFVAAGGDEPWGIRVNDALNFAKPVLVSDGMGARKLVKETGAGLVFESGSASDLAGKLSALIADFPRYAAKARAARAAISPEAKAEELLSILRRRPT